MNTSERTRIRQRRINGLALVVVAIWLGFALDPMVRPMLLGAAGVVLGGLLLLGTGMLLGALGFGLIWGFGRNPEEVLRDQKVDADFSDAIPRAKPSGSPRWVRLFVPGLTFFLCGVMALSMAGDPWGLLRFTFGGILLCFGVFVIVVLLAGAVLAVARAIRETTQRLFSPTDPSHG